MDRPIPWTVRAADVALGLSVLGWGVFGVVLAPAPERLTSARLTLSALQISVGILLLYRKPIRIAASRWELAAALPSLVASGEVMRLAQPLSEWPLAAEVIFALGGAGAVLSLIALGRCFAILPGARGVVARGPYRLLRHPAYAAELVMVSGCALALGLPWGPVLWAGVALLVVVRIVAEERPLNRLPDYREYARRVRWRLAPLIW